jgi:DNA polymerase III subunit alpha, Gram-positive type
MRTTIVFIDLETSGLDPNVHEITAFAGIKEKRGGIETLDIKIQMETPETADPKALEIQGYTEDGWKGALSLAVAIARIREFLSDCNIIVAHNVPFDVGFLEALSKKAKQRAQEQFPGMDEQQIRKAGIRLSRRMDTLVLALEHLFPCGLHRLGLKSVCDFLGITGWEHHRAMDDAKACRRVYYKLVRAGFLKRLWWRLKYQLQKRKTLHFIEFGRGRAKG